MSIQESDFTIKDCVQKIECLSKMKQRNLITEYTFYVKATPFLGKMLNIIFLLWKS